VDSCGWGWYLGLSDLDASTVVEVANTVTFWPLLNACPQMPVTGCFFNQFNNLRLIR
jgi:hypothetical protein